jgi:hypothetical protein
LLTVHIEHAHMLKLFMTQEMAMGSGADRSCGRLQPGGGAARRRVCTLLAGCLLFLAATRSSAGAAPAAAQTLIGSAQAKPSLRQDATFTILELRIADDGQGFDLAAGQKHGGLGLISIDERVRLVQGGLQIVTEPRHGTELRVRVPLPACAGTPLEEENALRKSAAG